MFIVLGFYKFKKLNYLKKRKLILQKFFVDNNILTLILSFCPGGIYEVAVIAIAFELDPNFVAFHHIIRLLMILFMVPVILKIINRSKIKD